MKRALTILRRHRPHSPVAQGDISSEFQNAPQQPAQPLPQPAPHNPRRSNPLPPQPAGAPAKSGPPNPTPMPAGSSFLGKDVPFFDPGSNIVTWDGKSWNINNNALFEARFEKYLNAPPAITPPETEYQATASTDHGQAFARQGSRRDPPMKRFSSWRKPRDIKRMPTCATPLRTRFTPPGSLARTTTGSMPPARLWKTKGSALSGMPELRPRATSSRGSGSGEIQRRSAANDEQRQQQQLSREMEMQPILTRLAEITALMRANQLKREVAELQVKIEFQSLIVQHFLQRRFQHALIGTRFYRSIFADGDSQLRVGEDAKESLCQDQRPSPDDGHDRFAGE